MTAERKYNKSDEVLDYIVNNFHKSPTHLSKRFGLTIGTIYNYRMRAKKILQDSLKPVLHLVPEMEVPHEEQQPGGLYSGPYEEDIEPDYATTDHARAAASLLEGFAVQLRTGTSPEDIGQQVVLVGRMMARTT